MRGLHFPVDSAGQWSYVSVISKGNQARLLRKIDGLTMWHVTFEAAEIMAK